MKTLCTECDGHGGRWGLAPHAHVVSDKGQIQLGGTVFLDKKDWPSNFTETGPGEGIYTCTACNGEGYVDDCEHEWHYTYEDERRCLKCPSHQKWLAYDNDWIEV